MSLKEQVARDLEGLDEAELQLVAEYVAFLKYRARTRSAAAFNEAEVAALYAEFADEDRELAGGMPAQTGNKADQPRAMPRDEILHRLRAYRDELDQFGVRSLALFGSAARDEHGAESDVDILVEFDRPIGLLAFVALQARLERALGRKVDLVTRDALRPEMRDQILSEAIDAG